MDPLRDRLSQDCWSSAVANGLTARTVQSFSAAAKAPRREEDSLRSGASIQCEPGRSIPAGNSGKSEAWVVLEAGPEARVYAGLKHATTAGALRQAIMNGTVEQQLASFAPKTGDSVFIRAGIVHSLRDVAVFEVQQNSDVTFRLYDWDHIDPETAPRWPFRRPSWKTSLMCRSVSPTYLFSSSGPLMLRKKLLPSLPVPSVSADFSATFLASEFATALAISVLPQPGGP